MKEIGQKANLHVAEDEQGVADDCATFLFSALRDALQTRGQATLGISGGSTPKLLFENMAKASFDWSAVHFFWVDERCVPPTDKQSNFKLADEALLTPARISKYNVHRVHGELPPEEGAKQYVDEIREFFKLQPGELPSFDIIHRGMGDDAHTASLFPGSPLIQNRVDVAASVWVEKMGNHRVTLLRGVLERAGQTVILAAGEKKAVPLFNVLHGPEDAMRYPCQIGARGNPAAHWFVDKAAVAKL